MYSVYMALRDARGLSDYAVAKEIGIGRSTLSDWKTGKHIPNMDNLKKIANYFDVPVDYLITGDINVTIETEKRTHSSDYAAAYYDALNNPAEPSIIIAALSQYKKYQNASPEVRKAIDILLKSDQ